MQPARRTNRSHRQHSSRCRCSLSTSAASSRNEVVGESVCPQAGTLSTTGAAKDGAGKGKEPKDDSNMELTAAHGADGGTPYFGIGASCNQIRRPQVSWTPCCCRLWVWRGEKRRVPDMIRDAQSQRAPSDESAYWCRGLDHGGRRRPRTGDQDGSWG